MVAPPLKHLCYAALVDLFKYLPLSKANPQAVDVRQKLQLASWMSIWPLQLERYGALGLSHSLGHKIGARYSIPHGITSVSTFNSMNMRVSRAERELARSVSPSRRPSRCRPSSRRMRTRSGSRARSFTCASRPRARSTATSASSPPTSTGEQPCPSRSCRRSATNRNITVWWRDSGCARRSRNTTCRTQTCPRSRSLHSAERGTRHCRRSSLCSRGCIKPSIGQRQGAWICNWSCKAHS